MATIKAGFNIITIPEHVRKRIEEAQQRLAKAAEKVKASSAALPTVDPWVKVGITTIDGTLAQVGGHMLNGGKPSTLRPETIEEFVDGRVRSQEPLQVGGRWMRLVGSHINSHAGTALIRCDVVRRLSSLCCYCDEEHLTEDERLRAAECKACTSDIEARLSRPPAAKASCPECGPHGNRGEVLLAASWARRTTCNGGDLVFDQEVEVKRVASEGHRPGQVCGFPEDQFSFKDPAALIKAFTITVDGRSIRYPPGVLPDGQVVMDDGTVATFVDGREVSRWARF